jgi:hypothetical protein
VVQVKPQPAILSVYVVHVSSRFEAGLGKHHPSSVKVRLRSYLRIDGAVDVFDAIHLEQNVSLVVTLVVGHQFS